MSLIVREAKDFRFTTRPHPSGDVTCGTGPALAPTAGRSARRDTCRKHRAEEKSRAVFGMGCLLLVLVAAVGGALVAGFHAVEAGPKPSVVPGGEVVSSFLAVSSSLIMERVQDRHRLAAHDAASDRAGGQPDPG